ncbi:hypothetical protein ACF0H5_022895 [Mactra antiquata]
MASMEVPRMSPFRTVTRPYEDYGNGTKRKCSIRGTGQKLTLDILQHMTPIRGETDIVKEAARDLLLNCIQIDPSVHHVFFPDVVKDKRITNEERRGFPIEKLAVAMVTEAISKCNDKYKFHCMIDKDELHHTLVDVYESIHWKKLGFCLYTKLYPTVVYDIKSKITLQDYIDDDGPGWAEKLIETLTKPSWVKYWMKKIVHGQVTVEEYNTEMNGLLLKLHLLDPQSVIPTFYLLNNIRALPSCNLELTTKNYLGGHLDSCILMKQVKQAVCKESCPLNVSKLSLDDIDLYYGIEVEEFILSYGRVYGIWNGKKPDNKVKSYFRDRCCLM